MKQIIIIIIILSLSFSWGENFASDQKLISKINEEGIFQSEAVISIKNKTKAEIYKDVIKRISYNFSNIECVIQQQVFNKNISIRGITKEHIKGLGKQYKGFSFIIDIDIQDEKLKIKLSKLRLIRNNPNKTSVCIESKIIDKNGKFKSTKKSIHLRSNINKAVAEIFQNLQKN